VSNVGGLGGRCPDLGVSVNLGFRILSDEEERKLLANAIPYIQDLIVFDLNAGFRIGELLSLRWENVDLAKLLVSIFAHKTHKIRTVPITSEPGESWKLGPWEERTSSFSTITKTGRPFVDLKTGLALACRKAKIEGITWHKLRHRSLPGS
jgi:integrase